MNLKPSNKAEQTGKGLKEPENKADQKINPGKRPAEPQRSAGAIAFYLVLGGCLGLLGGWIDYERLLNLPLLPALGGYFVLVAAVVLAYLVLILLHEVGHCLLGLLTGYRLVSFRFLHLTLARYPDGFRLKYYSIPGTAGQCLMAPPPSRENRFPYRLYLAGGVLMNLVLGGVLFLLAQYVGLDIPRGRFFLVTGILSLYMALENGIPMKLSGIGNDGHDLMQAGIGETHRKVIWDVLNLNARLQQGTRFQDLPSPWLDYSEAELLQGMEDKGFLSLLNFRVMDRIDREEYSAAASLIDSILNQGGLLLYYQYEMQCERLFVQLMLDPVPETVDPFYTGELKNYIDRTQGQMIGKRRLMAAYHMLYTKNEAEAMRHRAAFEDQCKRYPILGEIEWERQLLDRIRIKAEADQDTAAHRPMPIIE